MDDATTLELTRSVVVSDEFVGDDEDVYEIEAGDGRLEPHCAARVDGEYKHPLDASVTDGDSHESPQFDPPSKTTSSKALPRISVEQEFANTGTKTVQI